MIRAVDKFKKCHISAVVQLLITVESQPKADINAPESITNNSLSFSKSDNETSTAIADRISLKCFRLSES